MTGGIWVEGSTCGRGGLPESQERRTWVTTFLGPKGKNRIFVLPKVEPTRAKPYSPPSPKTGPQEQGPIPLHFLQLGAEDRVCLPLRPTQNSPLGNPWVSTPQPQPHSGFPRSPQPPWAAPSRAL